MAEKDLSVCFADFPRPGKNRKFLKTLQPLPQIQPGWRAEGGGGGAGRAGARRGSEASGSRWSLALKKADLFSS